MTFLYMKKHNNEVPSQLNALYREEITMRMALHTHQMAGRQSTVAPVSKKSKAYHQQVSIAFMKFNVNLQPSNHF